MKRPDILRMWINAIGRDFIPKKSHVICSAHFLPTDIMEKANGNGVLLKNLAVPSRFLEAPTSAMESGVTSAPTSAMKNVSAIVWRSILKVKENNATVLASILSARTQPINPTGDDIKLAMRKPKKVLHSSIINLKKQKMSPREKRMWRTIKTLRQKLKRKEEKINLFENLLKTLQYGNKSLSKHQAMV